MEAGHTRYATGIFTSTMKTNKEFSQIRGSCSPSNPGRSSQSPLAAARPATSSNYSRRVATRHAKEREMNAELSALFEADQEERQHHPDYGTAEYWQLRASDAQRRERVRALMAENVL